MNFYLSVLYYNLSKAFKILIPTIVTGVKLLYRVSELQKEDYF